MKTQTANKIGIESIEKRMQEISIDAGLFRKGIVKSVYTERCHKKMERLEDAVKELRAMDAVALLDDVVSRIKERAERVLEGEKWDLAAYVINELAKLEETNANS